MTANSVFKDDMDAPISSITCKMDERVVQLAMVWMMVTRVNVKTGTKEERLLITGLHTVADISCISCHTVLGWKYVRCSDSLPIGLSDGCVRSKEQAFEESQKYKEGKFIIEKARVMKVVSSPSNHPLPVM